jgi:hypothetical protein
VALVAAAVFAGTYTFDDVPPGLMEGLGAVEWPRTICVVILLLALVLALREPRGERPEPLGACAWWTLGASAGFVPVMALIGMLPAMFVFLVAVGWLWGERRHGLLLASAAGLTGGIWLVFVRGFGLTLPPGLILG